VDYVYKTAGITLMYNPELDLYGQPGTRRRDFLVQAQGIARQKRDQELDVVVAKYDKQFDALEAKLRKTVRALEAERDQLDSAKSEELFTTGEALLSLLRGRTTYTLSRISRSKRYKGYIQEDVNEREVVISEVERQLYDLEVEMEDVLAQVNNKWGKIASIVEDYRLTPLKKDIYPGVYGIGWKPNWLVLVAGRPTLIPAWSGQAVSGGTPSEARTMPLDEELPYDDEPGQGGYSPDDRTRRY
jgi:hypothetical protein